MKRVRGLGLHVTMTLVDCDVGRLNNYENNMKFLKELPGKINMTLVPMSNNPVIFSCKNDKNPGNWGLSGIAALFENREEYGQTGFALLYESHISFHAWPEEATVDTDIFSCYPFDYNIAIKECVKQWGGRPVNVQIITRGDTEYYEDSR